MKVIKYNWQYIQMTFGVLLSLVLLHPQANAQDEEVNDPEIQSVESMLDKLGPSSVPPAQFEIKATQPPSTIDYSKLSNERYFQDQVIIQKTYMPKTGRLQYFAGFTASVNDVFFRTMGGQLRAGYHFNETWGVEATGFLLSSTETQTITDLADKQRVGAESLITPASMYGVNAYFSKIYGKMALENRKIIPVEFYQTLGYGKITTKPTSTADTIYFGLGNLFSVSKNSAIRADLSWFFYNGKTVNGDNRQAYTIFFTIGYGRFAPEVGR